MWGRDCGADKSVVNLSGNKIQSPLHPFLPCRKECKENSSEVKTRCIWKFQVGERGGERGAGGREEGEER